MRASEWWGVGAAVMTSVGMARASDEARAAVAEAAADADRRTSLLQGSTPHAGWVDGFFLRSPDQRFRLFVGGQIQFRYTANLRSGAKEDGFTGGFGTQRTTLIFGGHVFDERLTYDIEAVFDSGSDSFGLEVAKFGYAFGSGFEIWAGQDTLPLLWEEFLFDFGGLAVDQSVVNAVFAQGDSQGVFAAHTSERFRVQAAISDGLASANTDFDASPADWALTGRAEWKFGEGDWARFDDFSSARGGSFVGRIGAAGHYEEGSAIAGTDELAQWTVDALVKASGWNIYAAVVGRHLDDGAESFSDFGFVGEGGVFVLETVELFARYDVVLADGDRVRDDAFHSVTAGVNWFWHGQAAKLTADIAWFLDGTNGNELVDAIAQPGEVGPTLGLLPSEDGSLALRVQFQLLF